ncbi:MAG: hypothetical protein HQ518_15150 [Rhodopirellula sp.]|nr:hypothetical protein [Rhodopirellula sp.]
MGVSFIGMGILLVIVLVGGTVVVSIISRLFRRSGDGPASPVARGVTLNCPHCGAVTEAAKTQCQHCSQDL